MKKFIKDIFTEKDGESFDPVRACGIVGFCIYNFISIHQVFKNAIPFDYIQFATGMGIILGAIAAGITFKYSKERDL